VNRLAGACALLAFGSVAVFSQAADSIDAGDRPFIDTETIDAGLLLSRLNIAMDGALRDLGVEAACDERVARAAGIALRHPEGADSTDENGNPVNYERALVEKEGTPCRFVMRAGVSSKTNCGSVRNFDDSDTYAAVASRYVAQMVEGNSEAIRESGFKAYGIGIMLTDEYPELSDGRVLTDEPKDHWIHLLFFMVQ
jgi:hypothetical protein